MHVLLQKMHTISRNLSAVWHDFPQLRYTFSGYFWFALVSAHIWCLFCLYTFDFDGFSPVVPCAWHSLDNPDPCAINVQETMLVVLQGTSNISLKIKLSYSETTPTYLESSNFVGIHQWSCCNMFILGGS